MPTTPLRQPGYAAGVATAADAAHLNGMPFSSPALTSPANDPTPLRPGAKAVARRGTDTDLDAEGESFLDEDDDEEDKAVEAERIREDREERARDADYVLEDADGDGDMSTSLSSPPAPRYKDVLLSSPVMDEGVPSSSSPPQPQRTAKEVRASQLAQIRAAKKARDDKLSASASAAGSAAGSTPSSQANASDRKRKASGEMNGQGHNGVSTSSDAASTKRHRADNDVGETTGVSMEKTPRARQLSDGSSSLTSLSDADAEGSIDGAATSGPIQSSANLYPATASVSGSTIESSVPSSRPAPNLPPRQASPSLADAFAAAKGESSNAESSISASSNAPETRVNVEVERTRAKRLQSLWPDRSLDQCVEALRRSHWNVTAAMEWLESVKPEAPSRPGPSTARTNGSGVPIQNGVVPSQVPMSKSSSTAKRPVPRGAIILGGAKRNSVSSTGSSAPTTAFSPPADWSPFKAVRAEDIPPNVRAQALKELSERELLEDSSQELATPPILPSSSSPARPSVSGAARSIPSVGGVSTHHALAQSALQARRAAEEAERARVLEQKRLAKLKRRREEEEAAAADDGDDDGSGMDEAEREAMQERSALEWFNTCDETALMDTINCNAAQAAGIVSLRPFRDVDDVNSRLGDKKVKGVTPRLFHNCVELMAGYFEVDAILAKCEKVGRMFRDAMADWNSEYLHQIGGTGTATASASGSRAGTPLPSTTSSSSSKEPGPASAVANGKRKAWLSEQPEGLAPGVVLKNYQLAGLNWLSLLYERKMSCILADEMGLGKTVQVIAFFAHLKSIGVAGPHLVVVPSSVLENWMREFRTFAPDLVIVKYYGGLREREELRMELREESATFDIMLTTYDMAAGGPNDHAFLRKRGFDACVFDEGHVLKSRKSQKYEKLMRIRANWRLLLTGTPLQNNLQELVSLLNFIMPTYFSSAEEALSAIFKVKASAQRNELSQQRIVRAKKMMQPFVLRRRKDKVLTELSSKTERIEYCEMTRVQKKLYNEALSRTRAALIEQESATKTRSAAARRKTNTSSHVLMDLRKAANHPLLFRTIYTDSKIAAFAKDYIQEPDNADENIEHVKEDFAINSDAQLSLTANAWPCTRKHVLPNHEWMNSGKVKALQRLLQEIKARGDRAIIFSQFTTVLDILCVCLDFMGIRFVGFTGQTDVGDRQELVDQFTSDEDISVFLLSTKAGGLGINLVAANWVILFDQDFNPQNDKQAADRAYRIGQTKEVHVVRLISKGTIDEDILRLGQRKLELENRVAGGDGGGSAADADDEDGTFEAGGDGDGEDVEEKVQRSLLTQLRDRAGGGGEDEDGTTASAAVDSPAAATASPAP